MDFSSANRTCVRSNGHLAKIDSESEDQYIKQTFISSAPDFWIGLTDQVAEGVFRYAWVKISTLKSCIVCTCTGGWKVIPYWYQITRIQTGLVAVQLLQIRVLMIASSLQVKDGKFMTTFVTQASSLFYADKKVYNGCYFWKYSLYIYVISLQQLWWSIMCYISTRGFIASFSYHHCCHHCHCCDADCSNTSYYSLGIDVEV